MDKELDKKVAYKDDVARHYARMYGIPIAEATRRINELVAVISDLLINGIDVRIVRFFDFYCRTFKPKKAKHLQTGEPTMIGEVKTVRAVISDPLKKKVQGKNRSAPPMD